MNPPLKIHSILNRNMVVPCPSVQACPSVLLLQSGNNKTELQTILERSEWALREIVPDAPRHWDELNTAKVGSGLIRHWGGKASLVIDHQVTLQPNKANEIMVVRASPK